MAEHCPLTEGLTSSMGIPEVCLINCQEKWDEASRTQVAQHDEYPVDEDSYGKCSHWSVEHSSDSVEVSDLNPKLRVYSIVNACVECTAELSEDSYIFSCTLE